MAQHRFFSNALQLLGYSRDAGRQVVVRSLLHACLISFVLLGVGPLPAQSPDDGSLGEEMPVPSLSARVTDLTGTLSNDQIRTLETRLRAYEEQAGTQIVILIVPTTGFETIEQYSIRVAEAWQIGRKDVDDGVILLVAKDDRALRIEVGYGLEGALPDARAKQIISDYIVPAFREGDFFLGLEAGIQGIVLSIKDEPLPEPEIRSTAGETEEARGFFQMFVFFGSFIMGAILRAFGAFTRVIVAGGVSLVIIVLGLLFSLSFGTAFFFGAISFGISVLGIMPGGRVSGGGGFSGGGFSGGGGGFSGGGGSFGGGGASGSW